MSTEKLCKFLLSKCWTKIASRMFVLKVKWMEILVILRLICQLFQIASIESFISIYGAGKHEACLSPEYSADVLAI